MDKFDVIVVGGGAAGLVAAISAAQGGARTAILEKQKRVGKKLLITGNGKCNYTNVEINTQDYNSNAKTFISSVFKQFGQQETLEFFKNLGIEPVVENDGRIFPKSQQASSLLNVLRYELKRLNIAEIRKSQVVDIKKEKYFILKTGDGKHYKAKKVILTTGGKASPYSAGEESGYLLARKFSHKIVEPEPALVQLKLDSKYLRSIAGVKIDGKITLEDGDNIKSFSGELLFTSYGISGIPALQVSRFIDENEGKNYIKIDLEPDKSREKLFEILQNRFQTLYYKCLGDALEGFVNKLLIRVLLKVSELDYKLKCASITTEEINKLVTVMKDWQMKCIGKLGWKDAQVTRGGVAVDEIYCKSMESKKESGLYFAGEILDVDGKSGGYNLQWAWSSGYIAGKYAAKKIYEDEK
ncbi:MAG: NAD(P)/FAD-dependent oxidoreductase [Candidatus Cloacimonetes bacterium]|nr:NAD(P)/FAD-dependent oxidoreductase [Candidatus Cloacimonadota bacterium]MBS3768518.1 NAD(P)/FAD-dependent oxidoreductase [Candidatus Cloacimonadota bacterium]